MAIHNEIAISTEALFKTPSKVASMLFPISGIYYNGPPFGGAYIYGSHSGSSYDRPSAFSTASLVLEVLLAANARASDPLAAAIETMDRFRHDPDGLSVFLSAVSMDGRQAARAASRIESLARERRDRCECKRPRLRSLLVGTFARMALALAKDGVLAEKTSAQLRRLMRVRPEDGYSQVLSLIAGAADQAERNARCATHRISTKALFKGPEEVASILFPDSIGDGSLLPAGRDVLAGLLEVRMEAADPVKEAIATAVRFRADRDGLMALLSAKGGPLGSKAAHRIGNAARWNDHLSHMTAKLISSSANGMYPNCYVSIMWGGCEAEKSAEA